MRALITPPFRALTAAVLVGLLAIAGAIAFKSEPDRYTFKTAAGQLQRFDKLNGEAMICEKGTCFNIDEKGAYHDKAPSSAPIAGASTKGQPIAAPPRAPTLDEAIAMSAAKREREEAMTNLFGPRLVTSLPPSK